MSQISVKEVEQQYHQLVAHRQYAAALDLATKHFELFPNYAQRVVYFWRINMACQLRDSTLALATLREAVEAGHWYAQLDENPNFEFLNVWPEFAQLVRRCAERRAEEMASAKPVMEVIAPTQRLAPYPLLFALHGNSGSATAFAPHWREVTTQGWLVALPQSPQAYGPDRYSWNDWDWVAPVLIEHYAQVQSEYPVDVRRRVLAGFSMGAGLALHLAMAGKISVTGVIAVAPFLSDVDTLRPILAKLQNRDLRIYLVASQQDEYCYQVATKLSALLAEYRIAHQLDLYEATGHAFPPSFESKVPDALSFLVMG